MTRSRIAPLLFLAPFTLLLVGAGVYPVARAAGWAASGALAGGGGTLGRLVTDRVFLFSLVNTVGFAVAFTLVLVPLSLGLAVLMNRQGVWGRGVLRGLFFCSYLVGPVYVAAIVMALLSGGGGKSGGGDWLSIPWLAMPIVLVASVWTSAGWGMVYLLAALQSVDRDLTDAARIDGAGGWKVFWHVTLPQISGTVAFVAVVGAIGALQLFELPFVLFQGAGPGNAALTLSMVLFSTTFEQGDMPYAATIGWALAVGVGVLSGFLIQQTTRRGIGEGA